jgi:hypothetical protein
MGRFLHQRACDCKYSPGHRDLDGITVAICITSSRSRCLHVHVSVVVPYAKLYVLCVVVSTKMGRLFDDIFTCLRHVLTYEIARATCKMVSRA